MYVYASHYILFQLMIWTHFGIKNKIYCNIGSFTSLIFFECKVSRMYIEVGDTPRRGTWSDNSHRVWSTAFSPRSHVGACLHSAAATPFRQKKPTDSLNVPSRKTNFQELWINLRAQWICYHARCARQCVLLYNTPRCTLSEHKFFLCYF